MINVKNTIHKIKIVLKNDIFVYFILFKLFLLVSQDDF
jgi:hypothetical protein